jgi:hypothetical protein
MPLRLTFVHDRLVQVSGTTLAIDARWLLGLTTREQSARERLKSYPIRHRTDSSATYHIGRSYCTIGIKLGMVSEIVLQER